MNRAYSILQIKALDEEQRIIEGVATTPVVDRQEDIVDPKGAQFKLPLPFLWQHRTDEPVGQVIRAKVTGDSINVRVQFHKPAEDDPQSWKDELAKRWGQLKAGLVKGLSIGFRPIETSDIQGTRFGIRYTKWEWLELSAVTVAANQEASITTIKAADQESARAASGHNAAPPVVRLKSSPGASGHSSKGTIMTNRERIEALEAKRAANVARMEAIESQASTEGRTFDETERQEFDSLDGDVKSVDDQLLRAKRMAELALNKARSVEPDAGTSFHGADKARDPKAGNSVLFVRPNVEKGIAFARYAMAVIRAQGNKNAALALVENNQRWMDQTPQVAHRLKAAVGAGTRTGSGWADDLVYAQNLEGEFIEMLNAETIVGRIPGLRQIPFNVRLGTLTGGLTGYWVGESRPIPMSKATTGVQTHDRHKVAGLTAISEELALDSSPDAEKLVRDLLREALVKIEDESFINPDRAAVAGVSPASVTNGVTPVAATGITAAALTTDIATLLGKFITAGLPTTQLVWITTSTVAVALSLMKNALGQSEFPSVTPAGGTLLGFPVIVSQTALTTTSPNGGNLLILMRPSDVFMSSAELDVVVSREASLEMSDAPTNRADTGTGASLVSMFQNDSMAIRGVHFITWSKRRSAAVQFINDAMYAA